MRTIKKRAQPNALTQWRAPRMVGNPEPGMICDYDRLRQAPAVLEKVEDALLAEQGGICAYTGRRIEIQVAGASRKPSFHIEHLKAQKHCEPGQDAEYANLVACWPEPNCGFTPAYGAVKKDNWPKPEEAHLFVSPLRHDCEERFAFDNLGIITAAVNGDQPATMTIFKLGLDDAEITELRRQAIRGALTPASNRLTVAQARKLLAELVRQSAELDKGQNTTLMPYCFAVRQAVEREIRKHEKVAQAK